jgi:1-acyl-sn-glycerol-3-phosphate acyltransferase
VGQDEPVVETLSRRALNRATLARQHLLERVTMPAAGMVEHLVGMQAQVPRNPYLALWSRLEEFRPEELEAEVSGRRAVRTSLMRATIHLVTAEDCLRLRPLLQPVLDRAFATGSPFGRNLVGLDVDEVAAAGRELVEDQPRTGAELRRLLGERWPDRDGQSLAAALTYRLPVVQVTPRGLWHTSSRPAWTTTDTWLGRPLDPTLTIDDLMLRYLAAFGPASAMDMQSWCGLTRLREVADRLRPRLRVFHDEYGRELLDLPAGPRPDPDDTPAPPRFLPEYDNVLLGHADRSRFFREGGVQAPDPEGVNSIQGSVLVGGQLAAWWNLRRPTPGTATVVIRPFWPLPDDDLAALEEEARRLAAWVAPDEAHDVVVVPAA